MPIPRLEWRPRAEDDLQSILAYIGADNPDAAQQLKDEIEGQAAALIDFPRRGRPGRLKGTRELVVRPNYLLVYRENARVVAVLRVLHAAQQWPAGRA